MITIKKFAMAVMLIAGFQQASADVCKLKVNAEIMRHFDKHGNFIFIDNKKPNWSNTASNGFILVRLNENGNVTSEVRHNRLRAIYCNKDGEIVINLKGIKSENERKVEAKRQFENIIKCGLISKVSQSFAGEIVRNRIGNISTQGTFNPYIFNTQFTALQGNHWVCDKKWKMPGISADISSIANQNTTTVPVMCAMKMDMKSYISQMTEDDKRNYKQKLINAAPQNEVYRLSLKNFDDIRNTYNCKFTIPAYGLLNAEDALTAFVCNDRMLGRNAWDMIFNGSSVMFLVRNIEHTERQLMLYHMFDNVKERWCIDNELIFGNKRESFRNVLIYTDGAPCFDEDQRMIDNGGVCCWSIYRKVKGVSVDVYFSAFTHIDAILDAKRSKNIFALNSVTDSLCTMFNINTDQKSLTDNVILEIQNCVKSFNFGFCNERVSTDIVDNLCNLVKEPYIKERLLEKRLMEYDNKHEQLFEDILKDVKVGKIWNGKYPNVKFHWLSY